MSMHVAKDSNLGLAAVGLFYKLKALHGDTLSAVDVFTAHPDPNAWGPFDERHDLEAPLDELIAIGYVQEAEDGRILHLYEWLEDGDDESENTVDKT